MRLLVTGGCGFIGSHVLEHVIGRPEVAHVVCRPQEALDCFLRTKMDVLVLGDWMVMRKG